MKYSDEKTCLCALNRIFGFKPKTGLALISHCGSAENVFKMDKDEKELILGPYSKYIGEICNRNLDNAYAELAALHEKGIYLIGITEEQYPALLKECEDAPIGLYIRSETPAEKLWTSRKNIAIVGTRDVSPYGREWCERTVRGLASSGETPLIVSGLALGVDINAHKAALDADLPTIGVMATGPETIYPYRNSNIAKKMVSTPGCALITDYPPGTSPLAIHFLRRNRIIAGLTQATILIESKIKGGGMMTSRLAFSYSREVYALPGRADDIRSQGCNKLIKDKIAEPLASIEELLESLGMKCTLKKNHIPNLETLTTLYSGEIEPDRIKMMHSILQAIKTERGITVEEIASDIGLPYHKVNNLCSMMESDGLLTIDLLQRCSIRGKNL